MFWSNAEKRWRKPSPAKYLDPGEEVKSASSGFTGILGHPFINRMPFMWGSTFWDIAVTDRRILAVERPILGFLRRSRKQMSFRFDQISRLETRRRWVMETMLYITTIVGNNQRIKLVGWPRELKRMADQLDGIERYIRRHVSEPAADNIQ